MAALVPIKAGRVIAVPTWPVRLPSAVRIPPASSAKKAVKLIAQTSPLGYLVRAPPVPGARALKMKTGFAVVTTAT